MLFAMQGADASSIGHVFVITMENTDAVDIYGKKARAPYINNSIIPNYARASNFADPLPKLLYGFGSDACSQSRNPGP